MHDHQVALVGYRSIELVTVALGSLLELTRASPPLAMLDPACNELDEDEADDMRMVTWPGRPVVILVSAPGAP